MEINSYGLLPYTEILIYHITYCYMISSIEKKISPNQIARYLLHIIIILYYHHIILSLYYYHSDILLQIFHCLIVEFGLIDLRMLQIPSPHKDQDKPKRDHCRQKIEKVTEARDPWVIIDDISRKDRYK